MTTHTCCICATVDLATEALTEIVPDRDRDGIDEATRVYACDECIAAATPEQREDMGVTEDEWATIQSRRIEDMHIAIGERTDAGVRVTIEGRSATVGTRPDADSVDGWISAGPLLSWLLTLPARDLRTLCQRIAAATGQE